MSLRVRFGRMWKHRGALSRRLLDEARVDERLAETNLFFLLGSGRCGTLLISRMLNQDREALVLHEPHRHSDLTTRHECRRDPEFAYQYIQTFRKYEIYKKVIEHNRPIYGEVSSPLRCLDGALARSFPHATFMLLVRDGRATVRSALNRQIPRRREGGGNHPPTRPLPDDHPYVDRWHEMSDFEQACWWWMDAYRMLLDHLPEAPIVHFERITKDYDYARDRILDPIGLHVTRQQYDASMSRMSANAAREYMIPHWSEWDETMRRQFDDICGPMMARLGYDRGFES